MKDGEDLPDPCTLLSEAEVRPLTGRTITQIDRDDAEGEATRFCQWQQEFELAGHLYVLYGTVQVDVYSRGDSDAENLGKATKVATTVMPRI